MKLPLFCMQCAVEGSRPPQPVALAEFRDDGRYELVCPQGHTSVTRLQQQRFEILFDIGAYAIGDGYYREAVSSFAASLERFYEFFIRALSFQRGVDPPVVDRAWKKVAAQSERQFGAFVFLYAREFGRVPRLPSERWIELRNDVIHKGRIPTRDQALRFGQVVLDVVRPVLKEAQEHLPDGVNRTVFEQIVGRGKSPESGRQVAMCTRTIISLTFTDRSHQEQSLEDAVRALDHWHEA